MTFSRRKFLQAGFLSSAVFLMDGYKFIGITLFREPFINVLFLSNSLLSLLSVHNLVVFFSTIFLKGSLF